MAVAWLLLLVSVSQILGEEEYSCPGNNQSAELSFVRPNGYETWAAYPLPHHGYRSTTHFTDFSCCATGFSKIIWYKDGMEIESTDNTETHRFISNGTLERMRWYSLSDDFFKRNMTTTNFTCIVFSTDGESFISSSTEMFIHPFPSSASQPWFTKVEAPTCLNEGDDLTIHCQLEYPNEERSVSRRMSLSALDGDDDTRIYLNEEDGIDFSYPDLNNRTYSNIYIRIANVTAKWLNRTYVCHPLSHPSVKSDTMRVNAGPCEQIIVQTTISEEYKESSTSVEIAVPIAVVLVVVLVLLASIVRYNEYFTIWYKVKIVQKLRPQTEGDYKYHAYLIYSDVSHPAVAQTIKILNDKYKLDLCVPDRDFPIGFMTPESLSEGINSSEKVIVFLSNDMFTKDEKGDDWSDVSLSLSLALNKPTIIVLLEDLDTKVLKKHKDIQAALKVVGSIQYSSPAYEEKMSSIFTKHFKFIA